MTQPAGRVSSISQREVAFPILLESHGDPEMPTFENTESSDVDLLEGASS